MAEPVVVHHPDVPSLVYKVPAEKASEWTEAGWKRVKREDESKVQVPVQVNEAPTK